MQYNLKKMLARNTRRAIQRLSVRQFSTNDALLVPLEQKPELPREMRAGFPKATNYFNKLQAEYEEFNALCETQRQQMFETRILNIM